MRPKRPASGKAWLWAVVCVFVAAGCAEDAPLSAPAPEEAPSEAPPQEPTPPETPAEGPAAEEPPPEATAMETPAEAPPETPAAEEAPAGPSPEEQATEAPAEAPAETGLKPLEPDYPYASIGNEHVRMAVYLPDPEKGYYRGHRFDWSGLVARAEYAGHTFFAPWQSGHNPMRHDHAIGTAEEFGIRSPAGYDEARPGESFLKIGIGAFEKRLKDPAEPETDKYEFNRQYPVLKLGRWQVARRPDRVEFQQAFEHEGWGYRYAKHVSVTEDGFVIRRWLQNTGTRPIKTAHYGHNFVIIDDHPVGPDYRVVFGFEPEPIKLKGPIRFDGRVCEFTGELKGGQAAYASLTGFGEDPAEHAAVVTCREAGAALRLRGDRPTVDWQFYAQRTAACPEPFVAVDVAPGKSMAWATTYTFLVLDR